jgi:hypothetical protein
MFNTVINTMIDTTIKSVTKHPTLRTVLISGAMLSGLAGLPSAAFARHHGFHVDVVVPDPEIVVPVAPCPASVVATPSNQVWVPPVYQTVMQKVWVPDVTTTQIQQVEVPAEYGYRDVVRIGIFGPRLHHERYVISPAHYEQRAITVVVTPGHFEMQTQQQLLSEGHWETQLYPTPVTVVVPGR